MKHIPVSSSNIDWVGYDTESKILQIGFTSGGVYQYDGVPEAVYVGLMAAGSHGNYFYRYIRDRYPTAKIE
jgi:hypothetical protein